MADTVETNDEEPKKRSKKPLLIGVLLAVILGGAGFYAVWSGLILAPSDHTEDAHDDENPASLLPDIAFVPIPPLVINIGANGRPQHLRFQAQLEVASSAEQEVTDLLPRIVDVLNGYLRAVEMSELEQRTALVRLRAQMLRRVQVVTGGGRVRDLLIMEFVLN
ncbi:MAG: flagellar basal body-associated FliL family protein [Marinosulfonomonas sp.]|nr:flagellar basal body-associated FliL family protein [Marinosulfonomonas sp.]